MSMDAAFTRAVTYALVGLAVAAVFGWFKRHQSKLSIVGAGQKVLCYGWTWKALAVAAPLLLLAMFGFAAWRFPLKPGDGEILAGMVLGVVLIAALLGLEVFGVQHRLGPEGIERISPWSRRRMVAWKDVVSVSYSERQQMLVLRDRAGTTVRLSIYLDGLGSLAGLALENVPEESIDPAAWQFLDSRRLW